MLGTLKAALDVRQVKLSGEDLATEVEGIHDLRDGLPVLTEIVVHYRLRIPAGTRESVDRALARHQDRCPTASSLRNAIAIRWTADIEER
jgi:organic hydroperoxide reductase OsmC/OhrA